MNRKQRSASASATTCSRPSTAAAAWAWRASHSANVGRLAQMLRAAARPRPPGRRASPVAGDQRLQPGSQLARAWPSPAPSMDSNASSTDRGPGLRRLGDRQPGRPHRRCAPRCPRSTAQSTEQVRPIAYSSRLRYCRFSRRTSWSCSGQSCSSTIANRAGTPPPRRRRRAAWSGTSTCSIGIGIGVSRSLHRAISTSTRPNRSRRSGRPAGRSSRAAGPSRSARTRSAKRDRARSFDRRPLVVADRAPGLGHLVGLDRLVGTPRRGDRERLQVSRNLEPQSHRRRNHQALLRCPVLGVIVSASASVSSRRRTPEPHGPPAAPSSSSTDLHEVAGHRHRPEPPSSTDP